VNKLFSIRERWVAAVILSVALGTVSAQTVDLTGHWDVVITTKFSQGKSLLVLEQNGQRLTGYVDGSYGKADLTGTVKGTAFAFTFTLTLEDGQASKVLYEGHADKDSLKGKVTIPSVIEGSFIATRR
jgi:hypothetical protein